MDFNISKVPSKITPCPIKEAVFEIRFESDLIPEIIPGVLYSNLQTIFTKIQKLPILELPQFIRDKDPELRFAPHHVLEGQLFNLQIGPRSLAIININEYVGWNKFSEKIHFIFKTLDKIKLIKKPLRLGLRYINFFENEDVSSNLKMNLSLAENSLIGLPNILRSEFDYQMYKCVLHLSSKTKYANLSGSAIDIDIIRDISLEKRVDYLKIAEEAHLLEKKIFFSLLKDEYLQKLNPEY